MTINEVSEKYGLTKDTLRYYEKIGVLPPVTRTKGGIRNYTEEDIWWLEGAICMRSAGLSVEKMIEFKELYLAGDGTIRDRLELLTNQRKALLEQMSQIEDSLKILNFKIEMYEMGVQTGELIWDYEKEAEMRKTLNNREMIKDED